MFQFETRAGSKIARVFLDNFYFTENKSLISILDHFFPCFIPETVQDILAKNCLKPKLAVRATCNMKTKNYLRAIQDVKPNYSMRFNLAWIKDSFIRSIN